MPTRRSLAVTPTQPKSAPDVAELAYARDDDAARRRLGVADGAQKGVRTRGALVLEGCAQRYQPALLGPHDIGGGDQRVRHALFLAQLAAI